MGHLTGAATERQLTSIEIVSDDGQQVLRIQPDDHGVKVSIRDATESQWSYKDFARLDTADAKLIAAVFEGGRIDHRYGIEDVLGGIPTQHHSIPKPEAAKAEGEGDCTPLDIERAKGANLQEAKQLLLLELGRDHALDRHNSDVPGCPACETRIRPGFGDGSLRPGDTDREHVVADDGDDVPF
jgi:hypothetical protein